MEGEKHLTNTIEMKIVENMAVLCCIHNYVYYGVEPLSVTDRNHSLFWIKSYVNEKKLKSKILSSQLNTDIKQVHDVESP